MSERSIAVTHEGKTYYGHIATIESPTLWYEDHGILTAFLHLRWDGVGVCVGGYALDRSLGLESHYKREGTAYGLDHIMALMRVVGVSSWEKLKGQRVIVLFESEHSLGSSPVGLANVDSDSVFILREHAEAWQAREATR